jgi:hypothetical protein
MNELAYLYVVWRLGRDYHSGQWSRGYRILCLAEHRCAREWRGIHSLDCVDRELKEHAAYVKPEFRSYVAFWLRRMRHSRRDL